MKTPLSALCFCAVVHFVHTVQGRKDEGWIKVVDAPARARTGRSTSWENTQKRNGMRSRTNTPCQSCTITEAGATTRTETHTHAHTPVKQSYMSQSALSSPAFPGMRGLARVTSPIATALQAIMSPYCDLRCPFTLANKPGNLRIARVSTPRHWGQTLSPPNVLLISNTGRQTGVMDLEDCYGSHGCSDVFTHTPSLDCRILSEEEST